MPKYFFNVHHGETNIDQDGTELANKHAAWAMATRTAGEILQELDGRLMPDKEWRMTVEDEFRQKLFVLHISAEVK